MSSCPFCDADLAPGASMCDGCGATRTTRMATQTQNQLMGRFIVWAHTMGILLIVWGFFCYHLYYRVTGGSSGAAAAAADISTPKLAAGAVAGLVVFLLARKIWRRLFGLLGDELWVPAGK